jgi:hypothetical protein
MRVPAPFALLLPLTLCTTDAAAVVWSYRCPDMATCPVSDGAGTLVMSEIRFNVGHQDFTWNARFEPNGTGALPTGLWAVVGKGPEPVGTTDEFAILYGDVATGRVSAYVYDKSEGDNSWQTPATFIRTFPGALTSHMVGGGLEWQLIVNVAEINSFPGAPANWLGLYFDSTVGFWLAGLKDADFTWDADGRITALTFTDRTSYDRAGRTSGPPAPVEAETWGRVKATYR